MINSSDVNHRNFKRKRNRVKLNSINPKKSMRSRDNSKVRIKRISKTQSKNRLSEEKPSIKCLVLKKNWRIEPIRMMRQTISKNVRLDPWQKFNKNNLINESNFSEKGTLINLGLYIPDLNRKGSEERKWSEFHEYKKRENILQEKLKVERIRNIAFNINKRNCLVGDKIEIKSKKEKIPSIDVKSITLEKIKDGNKESKSNNPKVRRKSKIVIENSKGEMKRSKEGIKENIFNLGRLLRTTDTKRRNLKRIESTKKKLKHPEIHLSLHIATENSQKGYSRFSYSGEKESSTEAGSEDFPNLSILKLKKTHPETERIKNTNLNASQFEDNLSLISHGLKNHVFKQTRELMTTNKKKKRMNHRSIIAKTTKKPEKSEIIKLNYNGESTDKINNWNKNKSKNIFFERLKKKIAGNNRSKIRRLNYPNENNKGNSDDINELINESFRSWDADGSNSNGFISFDPESPEVNVKNKN